MHDLDLGRVKWWKMSSLWNQNPLENLINELKVLHKLELDENLSKSNNNNNY